MTDCIQYILAITWGWQEWLIILVLALLIFGGRKIPELARSLGKSLNEFKKGIHEAQETKDHLINDVKKIGDDVAKETSETASLDENNNKH